MPAYRGFECQMYGQLGNYYERTSTFLLNQADTSVAVRSLLRKRTESPVLCMR